MGLPPTVVGADAQRPGHRAKSAAQNALVDHAIGRVVDALDGEGLTDDTLVIVTTDQGNPYGQRGLWEHPQWSDPPFVHDVTFRVPLIVRRPGAVPARRVVDRVVSHYDLFPTMLDYATTAAELRARLESFFAQHVDARYDLWKGGTGQAMVSRYLLFKERYGPDWNVTMEVGPQFAR